MISSAARPSARPTRLRSSILPIARNSPMAPRGGSPTRPPTPPSPAALVPQSNPPGPIAAVTFDVAADGILSVAHRHSGLLAAGSAIVAEAGLAPRAGILGALATASFAGIASMLVPWLITGGKL